MSKRLGVDKGVTLYFLLNRENAPQRENNPSLPFSLFRFLLREGNVRSLSLQYNSLSMRITYRIDLRVTRKSYISIPHRNQV